MRASRPVRALTLGLLLGLSACASVPASHPRVSPSGPRVSAHEPAPAMSGAAHSAVRTALAMLGTPYRYGGNSPSGFDCSGLVVYSYAKAGLGGLPRTAAGLEDAADPIDLDQLRPGDLLFFRLSGRKTSHVAMYVGEREFVHAPSSGGRVERVGFDHAYWGPRIRRAGRITR